MVDSELEGGGIAIPENCGIGSRLAGLRRPAGATTRIVDRGRDLLLAGY